MISHQRWLAKHLPTNSTPLGNINAGQYQSITIFNLAAAAAAVETRLIRTHVINDKQSLNPRQGWRVKPRQWRRNAAAKQNLQSLMNYLGDSCGWVMSPTLLRGCTDIVFNHGTNTLRPNPACSKAILILLDYNPPSPICSERHCACFSDIDESRYLNDNDIKQLNVRLIQHV